MNDESSGFMIKVDRGSILPGAAFFFEVFEVSSIVLGDEPDNVGDEDGASVWFLGPWYPFVNRAIVATGVRIMFELIETVL
jgi:hypothetical protein